MPGVGTAALGGNLAYFDFQNAFINRFASPAAVASHAREPVLKRQVHAIALLLDHGAGGRWRESLSAYGERGGRREQCDHDLLARTTGSMKLRSHSSLLLAEVFSLG